MEGGNDGYVQDKIVERVVYKGEHMYNLFIIRKDAEDSFLPPTVIDLQQVFIKLI